MLKKTMRNNSMMFENQWKRGKAEMEYHGKGGVSLLALSRT
jgi:hypothetical protein